MIKQVRNAHHNRGIEALDGHAQLFWRKLLIACAIQIQHTLRGVLRRFDIVYLLHVIDVSNGLRGDRDEQVYLVEPSN